MGCNDRESAMCERCQQPFCLRKKFGDKIRYTKNNYEALKGADALILVTEWNEFRNPDFRKMKDLLKNPVIFDGRNQYSRREMRELGFDYIGVGRPFDNRPQAADN